ncbi:MAG: hypothetical protein JO054_07950 [Actinobacteria bacterium]|nr:hypothetical protein [Actinomycetota bacterium]MBV9254145.1 hypothetical protein [Actinomycetota bacterium]
MLAMSGLSRRAAVLLAAIGATAAFATPMVARAADPPAPTAVPKATCGAGSHPETGIQGRVSPEDIASGRAAKGFTCNTEMVSHYGNTGGFRVHRYVDPSGHECAFYDTTLLFPTNLPQNLPELTGVWVLDMSDPKHPVHTDSLLTPAMQSPHESLSINQKRGLLAADMGSPLTAPGFVDIYDLKPDCRHPVLKSTLPVGVLGHEGAFSPDGNTFWVSSTAGHTLVAIDVSDPSVPKPLKIITDYTGHGLNASDDGNRLYYALLNAGAGPPGLAILDVSEIQKRVPNPTIKEISRFSWPDISIPQVPLPVTIGGHPYLVEIDEYAGGPYPSNAADASVGGARIIDIGDEKKPKVVSNIKLEANLPKFRALEQGDAAMNSSLQGYAGHYCNVPQRTDPGIVACSFIGSGLRVFDIRDPLHPKEIAYFNAPAAAGRTGTTPSDYAMSAPTFVPSRGEIWYSDGNSGFYDVHVTNGVWPFSTGAASVAAPPKVLGSTITAPAPKPATAPSRDLPATGDTPWTPVGAAALALAGGCRMVRRASRRPRQV